MALQMRPRPFEPRRNSIVNEREESGDVPKDPWYRGPIRIIIGLFLLLIIIAWLIPATQIKRDPWPSNIPSLDEVTVILSSINGPGLSGNETETVPYSDFTKVATERDETLKIIADRIIAQSCKDSNSICHAKALYFFVRDEFHYVRDPTTYEDVKTPIRSLYSRVGDCDDASLLLAALLNKVGIRTRFVFVPNHVFVQAWLPNSSGKYQRDGGWVSLDATCKGCEFGEEPTSYAYRNYQ